MTEIRLRELTPDQSRAVAEALLRVEGLDARTKTRILDACQGNPFFLEEVIHDLIEADLLYCDGEVWRARQEIETMRVPARVQSVILARYDRLDAAHKQALQHAAVIGRLFTERVLSLALAQEPDLVDALDALEERAFIYPERTVPEVVYSFRHVLAQEAVYHTIPGKHRSALHKQVGAALETLYGGEMDEVVDQLAYHYDRSDAGDKAIEYLLRAGDKAARAYLVDEAVAHYQRALVRIDELAMDDRVTAWRFRALAELGKTLMRSSRYDDAEVYLRQSIAWGKEKNLPVKEVVRLHWWLGDLLMNWNVRYAEMLQLGLDGLAMLPADERESAEAAMMYGIIAFGYQYGGDEDRFQQTVGLLAGLLRRLPYTEEFRVCYGCVIEGCWWRRDLDEADYWREHAERQARLYHVDWALAEHMWVHSYSLFFRGAKPHEAIDVMQESSSLFARVGDTKRVNWADISVAEIFGRLW